MLTSELTLRNSDGLSCAVNFVVYHLLYGGNTVPRPPDTADDWQSLGCGHLIQAATGFRSSVLLKCLINLLL